MADYPGVLQCLLTMKSKNPRMFSGTAPYNKFDIGVGQLETAIRLFLTDGCDMFSAITLAGCAGEIFHHLVVRAGKSPFVDDIVKIQQKRNSGKTPSRSKIIGHVNAALFINEVKHFDNSNDEIIEFDAEECALGAILKAIADYKTLTGKESMAMKAFLAWTCCRSRRIDRPARPAVDQSRERKFLRHQ